MFRQHPAHALPVDQLYTESVRSSFQHLRRFKYVGHKIFGYMAPPPFIKGGYGVCILVPIICAPSFFPLFGKQFWGTCKLVTSPPKNKGYTDRSWYQLGFKPIPECDTLDSRVSDQGRICDFIH